MKNVFYRVEALCKLHNMTINALETEIGVKHGTIRKWKNKETGLPSCTTLLAIAEFFNCSLDYLVGRETQQQNLSSDVLIEKVHDAFAKLNKEIAAADEEIQSVLKLL